MRKKLLICIMIVLIFGLLFSVSGPIFGQDNDTDHEVKKASQTGGIKSFWQLTEKAGFFRWPLFLTFIVGIIIVVMQYVDLVFDRKNAISIYNMKFSQFNKCSQIERVVRQKKSMLSNLVNQLLQTLITSPDAGKFTEELEKFTQTKKQKFTTFQNRMVFWSDTAGALGLLGTVWGMFITFFKGDMDQQAILSGMGIALITTLMGLVISVILNFCSTEVSGFFNKSLDQFSYVTDKLRTWVYKTQSIRPNIAAPQVRENIIRSDSSAQQSGFKESNQQKPMSQRGEKDQILYELLEISGNGQRVGLNQRIKSPLVVQLNQISDSKKNMVGERIIFSVSEKIGKFHNKKDKIIIPTNKSGYAEAYFTPEKINGQCRINVYHPKLPVKPLFFDIDIIKPEPDQISIKDGNHQSGTAGKSLKKPLVVEVLDQNNNPVPNCVVKVNIEMGGGYLNNRESVVQIPTDENGLASVALTLGKESGFNEIKAEIPGVGGKGVSFQALGQ
jgi:biopolymer transport protein ExbB/TolQ